MLIKKIVTSLCGRRYRSYYNKVNSRVERTEEELKVTEGEIFISSIKNIKSIVVEWLESTKGSSIAKKIIFNYPEQLTAHSFINNYIFTSYKWYNYSGLVVRNESRHVTGKDAHVLYTPNNVAQYLFCQRYYNDPSEVATLKTEPYKFGSVTIKPIYFYANSSQNTEWAAAHIITYDKYHDYSNDKEINEDLRDFLGCADNSIFMVIEVPGFSFLNSLLSQKDFENHYSGAACTTSQQPKFVIHLTPNDVIQHPKYQEFICRFPDTTDHFVLNDECKSFGYEKFLNNHTMMKIFCPLIQDLHIKHNLQEQVDPVCEKLIPINSKFIIQMTNNCYNFLRMKENIMSDRTIIKYIKGACVNEKVINDHMMECENNIALRNSSKRQYPNITFLGTGATTSSQTRGQSAIIIELSEDNIVLLDCGVGTRHQMLLLYGEEETRKILRKITFIFVSHAHTDHYDGLYTLLIARKDAFTKFEKIPQLVIMSTTVVIVSLRRFDFMLHNIIDQNISMITLKKKTEYKTEYGLCVDVIPVKHSCYAFGIALLYDGVKIVYSGDTEPCANLVKLGMNCDILIHESTHADGQEERSKRTSHSTVSQAIKIGQQMNAKEVYLTHFGLKHKFFPIAEGIIPDNVAFAFDFMKVHLNDTEILKTVAAIIEKLFISEFMKARATIRLLRNKQQIQLK